MATRTVNTAYGLETELEAASAGDTINVESGTYNLPDQMQIDGAAGSSSAPIVVNFADGTKYIGDGGTGSHPAIRPINCSYIEFNDLELTDAGANGVRVDDSDHLTFRRPEIYENYYDSMQFTNSDHCSVIGARFHDNYDPGNNGENADGLLIYSGDSNYFRDCLFYNNSDDGVDMYRSTNNLFVNCVSYGNGYGGSGDGNGFKMGIKGYGGGHRMWRCLSYSPGSNAQSARGFDWNNAENPSELYHCVAYDTTVGYRFTDQPDTLKNNIAYQNGTDESLNNSVTSEANTWDLGITDPQFASTDPSTTDFLRLTEGSPCVDAGVTLSVSDSRLTDTGPAVVQ